MRPESKRAMFWLMGITVLFFVGAFAFLLVGNAQVIFSFGSLTIGELAQAVAFSVMLVLWAMACGAMISAIEGESNKE